MCKTCDKGYKCRWHKPQQEEVNVNKKIKLLSKQEYNNTEPAQDNSDMPPHQPESTTTIIEQATDVKENKMSTMTEEVYNTEDKNNQINNDSDIEFDLDEDYDDDSDEEEIEVIDNYESDTEIGFDEGYDEGYDSENDDPYKIKQIDIDCEESNDLFDAKCELLDGINLDNVQVQIQVEWDKAEQKRLAALQAYNDKMEQKYQDELEAAANQSESENELEVLETLPSKDVIDPSKVYSQTEIDTMRANKYYKLANLLSNQFYMSIDYTKLLFAFKNDYTIDDNQSIFMLRDILTNKFNAWTDMDEDNLIIAINRKTYSSQFSVEILRTKWCKIQKIAKEQQPIEYDAWTKENLAIARQVKAKANRSTDKESHSVYRFLNQYKSYGDIKASIFYDQYVIFCDNAGDILSKITFAKLLKTHGINGKRTNKLGSCYPITSVSIKNWFEHYLE